MAHIILSGNWKVFTSQDNNRKQVKFIGAATATNTYNQLYSALQSLEDNANLLDNDVPMEAVTPEIYKLINEYFMDDASVEHLTGGSLFSEGWVSGTTEHILVIGYENDSATDFSEHDIGRSILGATTGDQATLLDFNAKRGLMWLRPVDPLTGGDEFDNGTEAWSIIEDDFGHVWQEDNGTGFIDITNDARQSDTTDFDPFPAGAGANDAVYFGFAQEFSSIEIDVNTAGAGTYTGTWEYWNGTAWTALNESDGTSDFKSAGVNTVTWEDLTDWERRQVDVAANLYWIRMRRDGGTVTTDPILGYASAAGQGSGNFASHARHGAGSAAGESSWVGITSQIIGATPFDGHIYIFREDPDAAANSWTEEKVLATKGESDWWGDGNIDISLKVKEADSIFGKNPQSTNAYAVFRLNQYTQAYGLFISSNLGTAGAVASIPLAVDADLNNTAGYRTVTLSGSSGNWAVGDELANTTLRPGQTVAIIDAVSGSNPTITLEYHLVSDPFLDFTNTDTIDNQDDTGTGTAGTPANVGPALDSGITITFGENFLNINNGAGSRPYSILIDPNSLVLSRLYERTKFVTRRGSVENMQGQDGEEYVGNELQLQYGSIAGGVWTEGNLIYGQTSGAVGIITADHPEGTSGDGDVILKAVRGTFTLGEQLGDAASGPTVTANLGTTAADRRTVVPVNAAPFGTFAGGVFFGAPGVALVTGNLVAGDVQNYQLIDDDGDTQVPPNTVAITVTNLEAGDSVGVFRLLGAGLAIDKLDFDATAANTQGLFIFMVDASISSEYPDSGVIRVLSPSNEEHRYRYTSKSGTVFTLDSTYNNFEADDSVGSSTILFDLYASFVTDGVLPGDLVYNVTQSEYVRVVSVDNNNQLTTEALSTGDWLGDTYDINSLVETYANGTDVYVPFIETVATGATVQTQIVHTVDIPITVRVRQAGNMLPFKQESLVEATGASVAAIRNPDGIFA